MSSHKGVPVREHIAYQLLYELRATPLGRRTLVKRTGLTESVVRTELEKLEARKLVSFSKLGTALTARGRRFLSEKLSAIIDIREAQLKNLMLDRYGRMALVRGAADGLSAWLYRDIAVREGATAALFLTKRQGVLRFVEEREALAKKNPDDSRLIEQAFPAMKNDDLIIIAFGPDPGAAARGLWAMSCGLWYRIHNLPHPDPLRLRRGNGRGEGILKEEAPMRWTRWKVVAVFALVLVGLVWPSLADYPVTVTDDRGKTITIPKRPERIVVAGTPLYTEILIDLGALDRIVGVSESADNPKEVEKLPKVGPAFNPNTEIIISLKPDVVFGAIGAVRETLERVGLIVVSLGKVGTGAIDSVTEIFRTIRSVNLVIEGDTKRADTLIGRIAEEIVTIEGTVLDRFKPTVAILYPSGEQPPFAAGRGTPENEIVLRAGGINVFPDVADYKQVSFEEIVRRDPSVIFTDPFLIPLITQNRSLQEVKAVREKRVYGIKASQWVSSRIAQTIKTVADLLHPNR
jgi:iron complex transport system substrate-binding protein